MLFFFYGSDTDKARARARGVIDVMKKKRPDAEYFRVTTSSWDAATVEQFIEGQGLFERKFIVFFDGVLEQVEVKEWLAQRAQEFSKSENAFVFLERSVDAATLKKFEKVAQEVKKFDADKSLAGLSKSDFNIFALADALGAKDKKRLWSLLAEAFMRGVTPEEVGGVLFWQVKAMLAASGGGAGDSGLKLFVHSKSSRYAEGFQHSELVSLSRNLISIYHDSHRGLRDFSSALERFSLSL